MQTAEITIQSAVLADTRLDGHYLFGPVWDFVLLGGGSLIALAAIRLSLGSYGPDWSLLVAMGFANIVNHPHFAHSYQIFYRGFVEKLTQYPVALRRRYLIAGVLIPLALIGYFATAVATESTTMLGVGANLMFLSVGWHYAKQGYGMAIVDSALKKAFYSEGEKKHLLWNSYATWIFSWVFINFLLASGPNHYFGIPYFAIPFPLFSVVAFGAIALFTTIRATQIIVARKADGRSIAWNGLVAYSVSLYAWLLVRDPIVLIWVPLFHSLQYLAVVWRFESNRTRSTVSTIGPRIRFALFLAIGFGLGYLGFWALPQMLDANVTYSKEAFGSNLFMFLFWIFINVHHYFLDSVMWRKGNPEVQEHLFAHGR